jgi:myo-inositol-1(or 4)-monophosphatase
MNNTKSDEKEWNELSNHLVTTVSGKSPVAVAVNTAAKAGEWIKSKLGSYEQLQLKTSAQDLVTEVDKGAEQLIRRLITTYFPDHAILGEEGVAPGAEASKEAIERMKDEEYLWIIDPIDGTTNFVHGFPFFCVSIALAHRGELIAGVIYDPLRDELFVGEKGKGAYVKGRQLRVSREQQLSHSLLASGFPPGESEENRQRLVEIVPKVRNLRTTGSAALHLAYVAAGRISGFWEHNLNVWDLAAGILLVQEAGGRVTDMQGNPYTLAVRDVAATNGHIHQELLDHFQV